MPKRISDERHLSVEEMGDWLREEIRNVQKECELRVREATDFTTAYAMGKLTAGEANKRLSRYEDRWGDALAGIYASSYKSDDEILHAIDRAHRSDRRTWQKYQRILEKADGSSGRGR